MNKKHFIRPLVIALILLIPPFFGNIYVDGWNWTWSGFVVIGSLIFVTAFIYELVAKRVDSKFYKAGVALGVIAAFLLVWVTLAVGFIGDENTANLLYLLMIPTALVISLIVKFEPKKLAQILCGMAVAQMLIPVAAVVFWPMDFAPGFFRVSILSLGFAAMWLGAAFLFRKASMGNIR